MGRQELNVTDESYRDWEMNHCPSEATVKARLGSLEVAWEGTR